MKTSDQNQQDPANPEKPKGKRGGARPNSGGARPGSGRPLGVRDQRAQMTQEIVAKYKITPLDYMLAVLNGDHEDARSAADRQWASAAAAPYMHPRLSQVNATTENKHSVDATEAASLTKDIIKSMFGG
jgi:GH18 family chitinase